MQRRKTNFPDRPLIRISSTFFWHLSADYDLAPIPSLLEKSRAQAVNLGKLDPEEEVIYEPMKVGKQVQTYVPFALKNKIITITPSELKHIALMA